MADTLNSYVRYADCMTVKYIKIENQMYDTLSDMSNNLVNKTASTVLYNDFTADIDGYYFSASASFVQNLCSIYRKTYSQTYFDYVCTLYNAIVFRDYNIHNNDAYEYLAVVAVPKSDGIYSYLLYENKDAFNEKIYSLTNWSDWSITNIEPTDEEGIYTQTGNVWILGLNVEGENLTQNLSISSWDTLGVYPKISVGSRNYNSGTMTCLLGRMAEVTNYGYRYTERENLNDTYPMSVVSATLKKDFKDNQYSREIEKYLSWKEFCSDGELKLLKDVKGNAWVVYITASPEASINTQSGYAPTTITFQWSEVMSVNDISIVVKGE